MSKEFIVECDPIVHLCTSCLNVVTVYLVLDNSGLAQLKIFPIKLFNLACWPLYLVERLL